MAYSDITRGRKALFAGESQLDVRMIDALNGYELRARSIRDQVFADNAVNDVSWPLVQELYAAHQQGQKLRTKHLCATSGLPQTTVLRYLDHLEKCDIIVRQRDPNDSRVTLVSITDEAALRVRAYYSNLIASEEKLIKKGRGLFVLSTLVQAEASGGEGH